MRIAELLRGVAARLRAAGCAEPVRDAEWLAMLAAGWSREELFCRLQDPAPFGFEEAFQLLAARRERREPMAYIRGFQEFRGIDFEVNPDVLIPRPETEILVERAVALAAPRACIADVGTGSGNIAVSIARELADACIIAIDPSERALAVAARNATRHGVRARVSCVRGSLLECAGTGALDLVVANLPYVAEGEKETLMDEVREHEPALALFAGTSGLYLIQALVPQAERSLRTGGWLLMEMGLGQSATVRDLFTTGAWEETEIVPDLQGIERVLCVCRRERA